MAYTFVYTDCAGHTHTWTYTYTITRPDFTLPADGTSAVNCPADAVAPTAPTVVYACGNTLTPVATTPSLLTSNPTLAYTFAYTDCAGHTHTWTYTYTITRPDFTLPADGTSTVNCPADAVAPTSPTVVDACGNTLTPVATTPSAVTCNGTMAYTFAYTDCAGHAHTWTYTYTITRPDFTLPADGTSTVNCPADAVAPTAPTVVDACGNTLTPVATTPSAVTCNGTMAYTFAYTDCAGHAHTWTYTYTITRPDFTLPADGSSTVNCPANAVAPTAPTVVDACGNTLTPVVTTPSPVACNGSFPSRRTYDLCAGHSHVWTYTYTIAAADFTLPADGSSTVNCPANGVAPTAPTVVDACGNTLTPVVTMPSPVACNGSMAYTFTYTDCAGHTHTWTYTYTIAAADFTLPADGSSTVNCPANAVAPTAPTVVDACGNTLTPVVTTPSPVACNGSMAYTFTYTDCAYHTHTWTYTYTIAAADFTLPADGSSTVNCPANAVAPTA